MQFKKQLLVIFFAYFLVVNESEAFFGTLFKLGSKLIPGVMKLFSKKKERSLMKRELKNLYDPYQRSVEMERLLKELPLY
uniref:Antimicrobial peptide ToAP2 n=1 Tax=Tityus obscurus TaxID=1221240 RepID=NDB32_TITOB|nr:RecName: Full=Antimicrobial peptide ToAP2; Flags: Precursor [Tityus obscurus]SBQ16531.1 ToAP2 [Tityus obscurus]